MPSHLLFFLFALSFLSGIMFGSLGLAVLLSLIPAAVLGAALFGTGVSLRVALVAACLMVAGCLYYGWDDYHYRAAIAALPPTGSFEGVVADVPKITNGAQSFSLSAVQGTLAVVTKSATQYAYGDRLVVDGSVGQPGPAYAARHIVGVMQDPATTRIGTGAGNPALATLFNARKTIEGSYEQLLSPPRSALLIGILFGVNDKFSKSFAQDLQVSGLRFITAIDGLHMQIVILIMLGTLSALLPRRFALLFTFFFVVCFVALTGFTISALRASLMAGIAYLAKNTHRTYLPYQALAFVALLFALINPKVLMFDVGFQLSFLAVISIIYLMPALRWALHLGESPGPLALKESLLITISVQLATAPIIISQFQTFSLASFAAGALVVWMLPFIIVLGFLLALFSFVFYPLAALLGLVVAPLLDYCLLVAHAFASLPALFNPPVGFVGIAAYYGALAIFLFWFYREA